METQGRGGAVDQGKGVKPAAQIGGNGASQGLSANAREVLASRYLKRGEKGELLETPEELFRRVARVIASAEAAYDLSAAGQEEVEQEFYELMFRGTFMPNSPTLMNAGRRMGMLSACFVLPVEDSIDGIFSSIKHTAMIQKAGGGTGFSFSRLRPAGDVVNSSGGRTSGPLSFLKVFSRATDAIQQGAFRRGANMGTMRIDHPDIVDFIRVKEDTRQLTNFNLSVSINDEFMEKLATDPSAPHLVVNPRTGKARELLHRDGRPWRVGELFDLIVNRAWRTGEPGLIFIDRMNRANPTPHVGDIEATNPCGEQPLLPYESCNLGSINLTSFVKEENGVREFDYDALRPVVQLAVRFLDNVIDVNQYPLGEIDEMTKANRKIGLGVMGFADALYRLRVPYDSERALELAEEVMSFINEESHAASEALAKQRGVFPNWRGSAWEAEGRRMRNATTTTVAPTGTISIIANCSGGIEPLFSLAFWRQVLDGKRLPEVNTEFLRVAKERNFLRPGLVEELAEKGTVRDVTGVSDDVKRIFVTAHDVRPDWHIRMQAAFQRHCDSSISKTINFPASATEEDVRNMYLLAFEEGVKGVTVYRDGSRNNQPMALSETEEEKKAEARGGEEQPRKLVPLKLPEIMSSLRIRQLTPFGNMHVKITVDPRSGNEREVFAQLGRGGDIANSDLEAICRLISLFLRCGGAIGDVVKQLDGIGSSLSVPSRDGRIMSLPDGLAKAIQKYLLAKKEFGLKRLLTGECELEPLFANRKKNGSRADKDATKHFRIKCPECAAVLNFAEGCVTCPSCGFSQC